MCTCVIRVLYSKGVDNFKGLGGGREGGGLHLGRGLGTKAHSTCLFAHRSMPWGSGGMSSPRKLLYLSVYYIESGVFWE